MKRVVVTGSEGFIGSNIVRSLTAKNYEVYSLDIAAGIGTYDRNLDIRSPELATVLSSIGPDIVIHCAAQIYVMDSLKDPTRDLSINGFGTLNVVEASIKAKVSNFIYIHSGGAVYDSDNVVPINEDDHEFPQSPYGLTKALGEGYVRILCEATGIKWSSLALSNVFGPFLEHRKGVVFEFANAILQNKQVQIYGQDVTRDFVYIDDVAEGVYAAIKNPTLCRVNISSAKEVSNFELFEMIKKEMASTNLPLIHSARKGEMLRSCLNNERAKELLQWTPKIDIQSGISMSLRKMK